MIGSTMSKMAAAEKLSIQQLQQAIKDGTVPAFIGVPLLQEKVKQQQQARAAQPQPQQPPVAQQVMQQAQAMEAPRGVEQLPSNLPEEGYALGGIVAFAEGGEAEDDPYGVTMQDYLDSQDMERDDEIMERMIGRTDINATPPTGLSYGQVQGARLKADKAPVLERVSGYDATGHKYDKLATDYSKKIGLPEGLGRYMLHRETGGHKDPDTAVSKAGAYGPAQIMPATAKGRGIDYKNPEKNVMGGLDYLKELYDKYDKDERLALAAYNAGPGRVDRAIKSGKGLTSLMPETQKYVGMAKGGIAHFDGRDTSLVGDIVPTSTVDLRAEEPYSLYKPEKDWTFSERMKYGLSGEKPLSAEALKYQKTAATTTAPAPAAAPAAAPATPAAPTVTVPTTAKTEPVVPPVAPTVDTTAPAESSAPESIRDKWLKSAYERMDRREKDSQQDAWMGLMAAGLGAMGSQSPYANVGLGQGALQGMSYYAALKKQRAAEEAADIKSMLTAEHYQQAEEIARERLAQQKGLTEQSQGDKALSQQDALINRIETRWTEMAKQASANELDPTKKQAAYDSVIRQMHNDPRYRAAVTSRYGKDAESILMPQTAGADLPQGVTVTQRKPS